MDNERVVVATTNAPGAIGPYSQAIQVGKFLFTSGQIGLDPITGNLIEGGLEMETRQALTNLKEVLKAGGADMKTVVKTTVFLKDINDFARMNLIYAEFFSHQPPARSAVQVAALPKGALVEIEAVAAILQG